MPERIIAPRIVNSEICGPTPPVVASAMTGRTNLWASNVVQYLQNEFRSDGKGSMAGRSSAAIGIYVKRKFETPDRSAGGALPPHPLRSQTPAPGELRPEV